MPDRSRCSRRGCTITGLRRTNAFLRLVLFLFGLAIAVAAVGLAAVTLELRDESSVAALTFAAAVMLLGIAEYLAGRFRLYRFGIEEALAVTSVVMAGIGAGVEFEAAIGFFAAAAASYFVYRRFGYLYAAIGSILCLCLASIQLNRTIVTERVLLLAVLLPVLIVVRARRSQYGDDYPGDEYGILQAAAWGGIYLVTNLHMLGPSGSAAAFPPLFYWFTFAVIWLLPALGLYLAVRDKDRPMIDVNLAAAVATLVTSKPYIGLPFRTWDPILLGLLLAAIAIIVRRRLSGTPDRHRSGFTASRMLSSDKRALSQIEIASVAFQPDAGSHAAHPEDFKPGGGRSGGAGAGDNF